MNIFDVLNRGNSRLKEPSLSAMLGYFLDTRENHGLGNLFLNELLGSVDDRHAEFSKFTEHTEIELESKYTLNGSLRWIDIELRLLGKDKNEICRILIENKINDGAANENQLQQYYEALIQEEPDIGNLLILFITPNSNSQKLNLEFENLSMDNEKHQKHWISWSGQENSVVSILRRILAKESDAQVTPMNEYLKHTIKALIVFVEETIRSKTAASTQRNKIEIGGVIDSIDVKIGETEYRLEKYESKTIIGYKDGEKVVAKDVIRALNTEYSLGYTNDQITKIMNTRVLGDLVIKALKKE